MEKDNKMKIIIICFIIFVISFITTFILWITINSKCFYKNDECKIMSVIIPISGIIMIISFIKNTIMII